MVALLMMLCACAVDPPAVIGWQPAPEGGREYLIQLAPETLEQLRQGYAVRGTMPLPGGDGEAYYRVTAGRGELPRRDGLSTTAGRVNADQPAGPSASTRWATPPTNRQEAAPAAGNRWDASRSAAGARRIEDMPDALMPVPRAVEPAAATTSRWGDLPPLERSGTAEGSSPPRRSEQEYRPPSLDPRGEGASLPRSPADLPRSTPAAAPSATATERRDANVPPLLPISDIDRATAKPVDRSAASPGLPSPPPLGAAGVSPSRPASSSAATAAPEPASPSPASQPAATSGAGQQAAQPEAKPWGVLVFVGALLFASVGLNFFLGWTAWDYRRRCEALTIGQER